MATLWWRVEGRSDAPVTLRRYETRGHGHLQRVLDRIREERSTA